MALVGYARVSTGDQNLDMQVSKLKEAGCIKIFTDVASGARAQRPGLDECLDYLREGDTIVVWKIDRLGRSVSHLVTLVTTLRDSGISFKSLTEAIDTTTAGGEFVFNIFAALAQMERELARERTLAGLQEARASGRLGGRPEVLSAVETDLAYRLYQQGMSLRELAVKFGVSKSTIYRRIAQYKED